MNNSNGFLSIEVMTPGEYRRDGEGVTVRWGVHETPVGKALFAVTEKGVCAIHFLDSSPSARSEPHHLRSAWPRARLLRDDAVTASVAAEVSARMLGRPRKRLSVVLRGTLFQVKVWQALLAIPVGAVTSYGEVAARIGQPAASRAAASAIAANAVAYLIPCHRVLKATGAIGGYRWGEARKRALLGIEGCKGPGKKKLEIREPIPSRPLGYFEDCYDKTSARETNKLASRSVRKVVK